MRTGVVARALWTAGFFLGAMQAIANDGVIQGVARALPGGEIAYRELHTITGNSHHVRYTDPEGQLIAEKTLDYRCDQAAPDWQQKDLRSGERLGGHWNGAEYVLQRGESTSSIRPEATLVASSGFDRFVHGHLEQLRRGETVEFEFALPARLTSIGMRIKGTDAPVAGETADAWFAVEPSSGLFRMFAGVILLGYDPGGELRFYRGPSNIGDGKGGSLTVEIRYEHLADSPELAATPEPAMRAHRNEQDLRCTRHDA